MKKLFFLVSIVSFILVGCGEVIEGFPEDKKVEVNIYKDLLMNDDEFSEYVEGVEFTGRSEDWGVSQGMRRTAYFLDINIESNANFESLSNEEKFYSLKSIIEKIKELDDFSNAGRTQVYKFGKIILSIEDNIYSMDFLDEWDEYKYGLVINGETYRPEEEQKQYLKVNEEIEKEAREKEIYEYMDALYSQYTNNGENYVPEVHDPKVNEITSKAFGITEDEANRIYIKYSMK